MEELTRIRKGVGISMYVLGGFCCVAFLLGHEAACTPMVTSLCAGMITLLPLKKRKDR